jgi:CRISPR-associated protein Cmr1
VVVKIKENIRISEKTGHKSLPSQASYLYWPFKLGDNRKRKHIQENTRFQTQLNLRVGLSQTELLWQAGVALWLSIRLGGLGTRSRRALGSLKATTQKSAKLPYEMPSFLSKAETLPELTQELQTGWSLIKKGIGQTNASEPANKFHTLAKAACRVAVISDKSPWLSWETAAENLAANLKGFRSHIKPRKHRQGLGLPIKGVNGEHERYSSPLILSITPLENGEFVGTVVMFRPHVQPWFTIPYDDFLGNYKFEEIEL